MDADSKYVIRFYTLVMFLLISSVQYSINSLTKFKKNLTDCIIFCIFAIQFNVNLPDFSLVTYVDSSNN